MGQATGLHHGAHIGEVQVDQGRHGDQIGDALNALTQGVVSDLEGLGHGGALGDHAQQAVVGNHDQGIHVRLQALDAGFGVLHALTALEEEGLGDHADGQDAHVAGDLGDDGSRAGAGAAAHAAGDEHQVAALDGVGDVLAILLSSLLAHVRVRARAQTLGQLFADLDLVGRLAERQRLAVGIDGNEFHALQAGIHHAVDRIGARAAHADDLDCCKVVVLIGVHFKFNHKASPSSVKCRW